MSHPAADPQSFVEQLLLQHYSPPAVLTNGKGDIIYFSARTGKYLEPAVGKANLNVFAMAREGLRFSLRSAFHKAIRQKGVVTVKDLKVETNGGMQLVEITVQTIEEPDALRGVVMIVFKDVETPPKRKRRTASIMGNANDKRAVTSAADLRRQAEKLLKTKAPHTGFAQVEGEALRLLHELQVHQIELELQNVELIQARDEVESALEKYTDLYDFAPVAYFTLDQVGSIRAANLTAASFIGIERSQLLGGRFSLLVVNEHRQLFSEFLRKVFASQGKESCEVMLTTESKPPFCVLIEAIVLGAGQEFRIAVIDITERKQAEKAIRDLNAELEKRVEQRTHELYETQHHVFHSEKLSAIGHLSASIAHEFNNPLQSILTILKGVKKRATMEDEDRELLDSAISESNRMRDLIRCLHDFNRPASGKQLVMDIHKSLNSLLPMYKSDYKGKRIPVVLDYRIPSTSALYLSEQFRPEHHNPAQDE